MFPDSALAAAVLEALIEEGATATAWNVHALSELSAPRRGIADLSGIERLDSLALLDLRDNEVSDLRPLADLRLLRHLDISGNRVTDLSPLAGLESLEVVLLSDNEVHDGGPLLGLPFLLVVDVTGTPLTDEPTFLRDLEGRGVSVRSESSKDDQELDPEALTGEIAFSSRRDGTFQIYVVDLATRATRKITDGPGGYDGPAWSPDGEHIAFTRYADLTTNIHIVDVDGKGQRLLLSPSAWRDSDPSWRPDGKSIIFSSSRGSCTRCDTTPKCFLCQVDIATGVISPMLPHTGPGFIYPALSPDGRRIAFLRGFSLMMVDLTTGVETVLNDSVAISKPAWHPDGDRIVYAAGEMGFLGIRSLSLSSGDLQTLTGGEGEQWPAWSRDGRALAYHLFRNGDTDLFVESPVGSPPINITASPGVDTRPAWRPR